MIPKKQHCNVEYTDIFCLLLGNSGRDFDVYNR